MTEEEARMKYCPHNKDRDGQWFECIASSCMMWESYEYWLGENDKMYAKDNENDTRKHVAGGECGLKTKELQCNAF